MASIFISYRTNDEAFAVRLQGQLTAEHDVWLDSQDLPAGEKIDERITAAIAAAEIVIVVISGEWLASEHCRRELALAVDWNKRIVPIEPRRLRGATLPAGLKGLSPIGFWRAAGFEAAMVKLMSDIVADHDWLEAHRDLLVDALRWERSQGVDVRLRGNALRTAVRHVERSATGAANPPMVPVQLAYVRACEAAEAAEIERLAALNRRAVARHLLAEAQRAWAADSANIGLALRLVVESLRRSADGVARGLLNELTRHLPRVLRELPGTEGARLIRFAPRDSNLAIACGARVQVWQTLEGRVVLDQSLPAQIQVIAFDGSDLVAMTQEGELHRFERMHRWRQQFIATVEARHAVLDASACWVAWARGESSWVRSLRDSNEPPSHFRLSMRVNSLALSPGAQHLLVCAQGPILPSGHESLVRLIDLSDGSTRDLSDRFHMEPAFSADGKWVAASAWPGFKVWSVADGCLISEVHGHFVEWMREEPTIIFRRKRMLRSDEPKSSQHELLEWSVGSDGPRTLLYLDHDFETAQAFRGRHRDQIAIVVGTAVKVFHPLVARPVAIVPCARYAVAPLGEQLATVSDAQPVRVVELGSSDERTIGPFLAGIDQVAASPNGHWIARSLTLPDGTRFGSMRADLQGAGPQSNTEGDVISLVVANDGTFAAILGQLVQVGSGGATTRGTNALVVARPDGLSEWPCAQGTQVVAISPDGRHVAAAGARCGVSLFEGAGQDMEPMDLPVAGAKGLEFDDSSRFLVATGDRRIDIFDISVRSSADAAYLGGLEGVVCSCFDPRSRLWVVDDEAWLRSLALPSLRTRRKRALGFQPQSLLRGADERTLLAVHEHAVIVVDAESGKSLQRLEHLEPIKKAWRSPSGRHLLVATSSDRASVWALSDATQLFEIDEADPVAIWLAGDRLAIRKGDRFEIEPMDQGELLRDAIARAGGPLSRQEWQTYLPEEPWPAC